MHTASVKILRYFGVTLLLSYGTLYVHMFNDSRNTTKMSPSGFHLEIDCYDNLTIFMLFLNLVYIAVGISPINLTKATESTQF